jgi:hypothetical protein
VPGLAPFAPVAAGPDRTLTGVDGFTVPLEAVRAAAEAADRVVAVVAPVDLSGPLRALAAGLPGSSAARTALGPGADWAAGLTALGTAMGRHADAMTETARAYRDSDHGFAAGLPATVISTAIGTAAGAAAGAIGNAIGAELGGAAGAAGSSTVGAGVGTAGR